MLGAVVVDGLAVSDADPRHGVTYRSSTTAARIVWSVNARKLRLLMATADERRPRVVDVRDVAPDTLLEFLREQGLTS